MSAGAQVKTTVGADAVSGNGSAGASLNSGGVTPIGTLGGTNIAPLSLTPGLGTTLSAPALSLNQGLVPSALSVSVKPAAATSGQEKKTGAIASAANPKDPPNGGGKAATTPPGPPYFVQALIKLGVSKELAGRLESFLATRHPGDQDKIYHGLGHSHEVADLTARILDAQSLPAEKKILLLLSAALHDVDPDRAESTPARVSATLTHLDSNDEARALLVDFGGRYGFTAAQVKALIMATDFSLDAAEMKQKQDAFVAAAKTAFADDAPWALNWGKHLAFADQTSTYVGSLEQSRKRVEGLAAEIRAQLTALGKGPGPSDVAVLADTHKFLKELRKNELFATLPDEQKKNFLIVQGYFQLRTTPAAWTKVSPSGPSRAPPGLLDLKDVKAYIKDIMGGSRAPTEREADSLLGDWLEEQGIPRESMRANDVRRLLIPSQAAKEADAAAKLNPALRRHAALLTRIAAERRLTVAYVESVIIARGLLEYLPDIPDSRLEAQILMALNYAALQKAVAKYPDNAQGELLRAVADTMGTKGGKSVEEVARDGVFVYADFNGLSYLRSFVSRDPDIQGHTIAFYITRDEGKWKIAGYRQKTAGKNTDRAYINALKSWLSSGGLPASDFH